MFPFSQLHKLRPRFWQIMPRVYQLCYAGKDKYECPLCHYHGPFVDICPPTGHRRDALCVKCGALERHRLQGLVTGKIFAALDTARLKFLHFAPEPFFKTRFKRQFGTYETADLYKKDVDHQVDIQNLPFANASYDVVYASHVLEHIADDRKAIGEVRRILRPSGLAILPVPLVSEYTVEYDAPDPLESYHVRAPGLDYYERFNAFFSRVEYYSSDLFPKRHQLNILLDEPILKVGINPPKDPHIDVVPVCYV